MTVPRPRILRGAANRLTQVQARVRSKLRRWRRRRSLPRIAVLGPTWFSGLLTDEARLVPADDVPDLILQGPAGAGVEAAASRVGAGAATVAHWSGHPFVQATRYNPTDRSRPTGHLPEPWRGMAEAAMLSAAGRLAAGADPETVDDWLRRSAAAHHDHRSALGHTASDELVMALGAVGRANRGPGGCTVVCVTNRPHQLEQVIANYVRQESSAEALIVVTNSSGFDPDLARSRLATVRGASMIEADERLTLGACLNLALDRVTTRYTAKFDDDDIYGEHFLSDLLLAHTYADAAVVGKHSHYVTMEQEGFTAVRFPGREFEYTSHLAGGTLVIDLERSGSVRFPDQTLGEDRGFIRRCALAGHLSFAADRFNYVQVRGADHTWDPGEAYMEGLHVVARDIRPDLAML